MHGLSSCPCDLYVQIQPIAMLGPHHFTQVWLQLVMWQVVNGRSMIPHEPTTTHLSLIICHITSCGQSCVKWCCPNIFPFAPYLTSFTICPKNVMRLSSSLNNIVIISESPSKIAFLCLSPWQHSLLFRRPLDVERSSHLLYKKKTTIWHNHSFLDSNFY